MKPARAIGRWLLTLGVMLPVGCSSSGGPPPAPKTSAASAAAAKEPSSMQCLTGSDLERAWDRECRVTGTWRVRTLTDKKGRPFRTWPVVELDDGADVLIGSIWRAAEKPADEMTQRYAGQRVSVTGTLNAEPPGSIQNIALPCLSPVTAIEPAP